MGLDFKICVKTQKGKLVDISNDLTSRSRYYGPHRDGWCESGYWPGLQALLLETVAEKKDDIYYGSEDHEPEEFMLVTPELLNLINRHYFESLN